MKENSNKYLYLIFTVVGFIFLKSGLGKLTGGEFVNSLGTTLAVFASKNPNPWIQSFLNNIAIPNSQVFGFLTMWGEFLTGVNLVFLSLYLLFSKNSTKSVYLLMSLGFAVGFILNMIFWLSAGWISPSTDSVNLVMESINVIGFFYALKQSKQQ